MTELKLRVNGKDVVGTQDKEPFVLVTKPAPGVCLMTFNRPKTLNALSAVNAYEVYQKVLEVQKDDSIRAVVITGSGRGFSAGADLSGGGAFYRVDEKGEKIKIPTGDGVAMSMEVAYNPMAKAIYELEKPIIVAVNGVAAGGGVGVALLGDIVLAGESAKFVNVFAPKVGLAPDLGATWTLPRLVGRARALAMSLLGEPMPAKEAEQIGLIYKCVPDQDLLKEALRIASQLAKGPTLAFYQTRRMFDTSWTKTMQVQLDEELKTQAALGAQPDYTVGIRKFRGDKSIEFTGSKTWPAHLLEKSKI